MNAPDPNDLPLPELARRVLEHPSTARLLEAAREEDLGAGTDVTSASVIDPGLRGRAAVVAREPGVVSGLAFVPAVLEAFGTSVRMHAERADGDRCDRGDRLAVLEGPVIELLAVERTVLNLVGQL